MRTLISLAAIALLSGCSIVISSDDSPNRSYTVWGENKTGNGVAATEQRAVASTMGVDVSGSLPVAVQVGQAASLSVQGDANLLPLIRTEVKDGVLRIWSEHRLHSTTPIKIVYTTPHLNEVKAGGASRVEVQGLSGNALEVRRSGSARLRLEGQVVHLTARSSGSGSVDATGLSSSTVDARLSGSSQLRLGNIQGDFARFALSGSSTASASGSVRSLVSASSGSSRVELAELHAVNADLAASGASRVRVHVSDSLQASTSGSSDVRVTGNPQHSRIVGKRVHLLN